MLAPVDDEGKVCKVQNNILTQTQWCKLLVFFHHDAQLQGLFGHVEKSACAISRNKCKQSCQRWFGGGLDRMTSVHESYSFVKKRQIQ